MIEFNNKYFKEFKFSRNQINRFMISAVKDLKIAEDSKVPEVQFQFSYNFLSIKFLIMLYFDNSFCVIYIIP